MKRVIFFTLVVWPLIQEAVHSELQEDSLRRLHEHEQGDWPVWEAAAVFPDESVIAELALPGSHPIRPRNQYRRRRKRPRPQTPQEEAATQPVPNQPLQNYQVSESPESDSIAEELPYIPTREPNFQHQTETNHQKQRRRPAEPLHDSSQEETESQSYEYKNNFTPKRPRGHKNQFQEPETESDSFKAQSSEAPQDLKALLRQHSGSLSLSEILQQKNLSLADLLKGNHNALSAVSGTQDEPSDAQEPPPPPPRRLPSSRPKLQNADNQRPLRYSGNQSNLNEELTTEVTVQRRLPPARRQQALSDSRKPTRFRDQENVDADTQERINKFVPSAPRRTSTASSTESIEVTNSIISDPVTLVQNEEKNKASDEEVGINSSTEYNEIIPQTSEPPLRTTDNDIQSTRSHIPLAKQETSLIDPINNVPQDESLKRLRGKYLTRHRVSPAQSDVPNRFRLPPTNLFQRPKTSSTEKSETHESTQNNFVLEKDVSSTVKPEKTLDTSTVQPQKIEDSSETEGKPTDPESLHVKIEEINDDDEGNVIPGKLDTNVPDESKSHHEDDGPMHKVIPLNTEIPNIPPGATSARDEILEFLKTDMDSLRLARILASRNMTLAELIDHRERGSSQQHLAEIFEKSNQPNIQENESQEDKTNPDQNDDMHSVLKYFQRTISTNNDIPSIQEMFGFLNDHHGTTEDTNTSTSENSNDTQVNPNKHSESQEEQISSENKNIFPDNLPTFPPQKPPIPIQNPHTAPPRKFYQTPPAYSFEPINPYVNPAGQRSTPRSDDIIALQENMGEVRELENNYRDVGILFGDDLEDEITTNNSGLPQDVKSAIIVSSAILGVAIMGFLTIFVVCRWKQKRARRRFVEGIINTKARSPILMQPDGKNPGGGINPIMISSNDLYTRDLSINSDPATRKYYLWRTIRKTLRYK